MTTEQLRQLIDNSEPIIKCWCGRRIRYGATRCFHCDSKQMGPLRHQRMKTIAQIQTPSGGPSAEPVMRRSRKILEPIKPREKQATENTASAVWRRFGMPDEFHVAWLVEAIRVGDEPRCKTTSRAHSYIKSWIDQDRVERIGRDRYRRLE